MTNKNSFEPKGGFPPIVPIVEKISQSSMEIRGQSKFVKISDIISRKKKTNPFIGDQRENGYFIDNTDTDEENSQWIGNLTGTPKKFTAVQETSDKNDRKRIMGVRKLKNLAS